ncbi:MAG: molecular chaperone HtpG [Cloacibacillus porcorum]|uniref:molecular chaperone HtpG n=1 Tax=Cloacibacillus porcorum TaxID=1197717 RepID=UPI0023530D06|nr:molecular chaperone HtpG [Cloacibacillus porcorum]MCI5864788.1 molecular chaperone HtpG [Cloacibacillus porcorum]
MAEKMEFQSEAKQVLELMINSVYSNPDIFVRELISNASDAIDKLRIESLSHPELAEYAKNGRIDITIDKKAGTLTISDNGIGMDRDDLVSYLGTIARSGTGEFIRAMQEAKNGANSDLIGQFGVGFYSSFIAADRVTVETLKAGGSESWKWESTGDGTYTIDGGSRAGHGSSITLHMKKEEQPGDDHDITKDYLSEWTLRGIIKEYSDFVTYPIYLTDVEKEKKEDEKEEPVNSMKALWTRPQKDISDDEFNDFYRHISHDWENPLERIYYKAEGTSEFRALLFIPSRPPMDLFYQDGKHGVQLYIRRVFIMNDCKDLIPEYMRFIKGVVDSEDLSLNVSREMLQQDRQTAQIKNSLVKKILDTLHKMRKDQPDSYNKFWQTFGVVLKEGIISDLRHREEIMKLCLFDVSEGDKTTLEDYLINMPAGQDKIYYLAGSSLKNLKNSPKLEAFKKKGIKVLLLGDPVDEIWVNHARKFDKYDFVSAAAENLMLPEGEKDEKKDSEIEKSGLVKKLKDALGSLVEDVKVSDRLVDSPVCFVQKGEEISPQMRNLFRSMGQEVPEEKRVMEINPDNALIKKIADESEKENFNAEDWSHLLMGLASIADGEPVPDGQQFTNLVSKLLEK